MLAYDVKAPLLTFDFTGMSNAQPQLYQSLTSSLGPEEQQVIKVAIETADKIAAERAANAANAPEGGVQQQQAGGAGS